MKKSNIVDFQFPDMPIWNTHGIVRDAALDSSLHCCQAPIYSQAHAPDLRLSIGTALILENTLKTLRVFIVP
jgi:hypothetical protein